MDGVGFSALTRSVAHQCTMSPSAIDVVKQFQSDEDPIIEDSGCGILGLEKAARRNIPPSFVYIFSRRSISYRNVDEAVSESQIVAVSSPNPDICCW